MLFSSSEVKQPASTLLVSRGRWIITRLSLHHLIALGGLMLILCHLVWNIGLMHTDDAEWALAAVDPNSHPIRDFAVSQGRLWAWPVGGMMLHALRWQGTLYGEALKIGSFVIFFVSFQWLVFVYCGRSTALLSAYLFLGLLAVRWDGSVLTAYPLLVWPSGTVAIVSILLARAYRRGGRPLLLVPTALALFFSLFENEGITVAIIILFMVTLAANELSCPSIGSDPPSGKIPRRSLQLLFVLIASSAAYFASAFAWSRLHPTQYDGHKFADFNIVNILRILFHFSSNGSVLHDLLTPYNVTFSDRITGEGRAYAYDVLTAAPSIFLHPAALAVGLIVAVMIYATAYRVERGVRKNRRTSKAVTGIAIGLVVMLIPMLPVAMLSKYQDWFLQAGVRAYNGTVIAHFGDSLLIAVVGVWIIEGVGWRVGQAIGAVFALSIGTLSCLGYAQNADLVADMRHEGARWQVFDHALALSDASGMDIRTIWAPRFANGTWFTVVPDTYWKSWAELHFRSPVALKSRDFFITDAQKGLALLDYHLFDDARDTVITLAHVDTHSFDAGRLKVDKIAVFSDNSSLNALANLYIHYVDLSGKSHEVRLADLPQIPGHADMRSLDRLSARLDDITLSDQSSVAAVSLSCPDPLPDLMNLVFSSDIASGPSFCDAVPLLRSGWWAPEPSGVWSVAPTADLLLPTSVDPAAILYVDVDASSYTGMGFAKGEQTIGVYVKGSQLAAWSFSDGGRRPETHLVIPPNLREADGRLHIEFRIDRTISPSNLGQSRDNRELGILLCEITLTSHPLEERRGSLRGCTSKP